MEKGRGVGGDALRAAEFGMTCGGQGKESTKGRGAVGTPSHLNFRLGPDSLPFCSFVFGHFFLIYVRPLPGPLLLVKS